MSSALIGLAIELGTPLVRSILSDKLGVQNAQLAEKVVGAVADRLGVEPRFVDQYVADNPQQARVALEEVEQVAPEFVKLAFAEAQTREALLLAETAKGGWQSAWRPAWMFLLGFLWVWNLVFLHVLNAIFKIKLPMADLTILLGLSGLFLSLYMGGHTVKAVMSKGLR